jgi:hypothetical protein
MSSIPNARLMEQFKSASSVAAGMAVALSVTAVSPPASAAPPEKDSVQYKRMFDHADFIINMKTKGGLSCCNMADGRMGNQYDDLPEKQILNEDGTTKEYRVFVTKKVFCDETRAPGNVVTTCDYDSIFQKDKLEEYKLPNGEVIKGHWVTVSLDKILTAEEARKNCPKESTTCFRPEENVIWYTMNDHVWCYSPVHNSTRNDETTKFAETPRNNLSRSQPLLALAK